MKIISPLIKIRKREMDATRLQNIEYAARICYKSEQKTGKRDDFLEKIIKTGHESVLEHEKITVVFTIDRGISHELVRHRIASYSQESTRYCNYSQDRFGNEITVIEPFFYIGTDSYVVWRDTCEFIEKQYIELIRMGVAQEARSVLPNSLKTEIVVTFNLREWRHFFKLRCQDNAHPQMQQVAIPLLLLFKSAFKHVFDDIPYNKKFHKEHYAEIILMDDE